MPQNQTQLISVVLHGELAISGVFRQQAALGACVVSKNVVSKHTHLLISIFSDNSSKYSFYDEILLSCK
jgi:hypothetical protein